MRDYGRISVIVLLAVLGDGAAAYAQGSGHFNRVTTTAADAIARASVASTARSRRQGGASLEPIFEDASPGPIRFGPTVPRRWPKHETSASQAPSGSSWEQEPQRPGTCSPGGRSVATRTYYPGHAAWSGRPATGDAHRSDRHRSATCALPARSHGDVRRRPSSMSCRRHQPRTAREARIVCPPARAMIGPQR